jgi:hypothetical protein
LLMAMDHSRNEDFNHLATISRKIINKLD